MSYTFTVSTISPISFLDGEALLKNMGLDPTKTNVYTYTPQQAERYTRKCTAEHIFQWWGSIQERNLTQLGSKISWDEASTFERVRDVYPAQDLELSHLLAYIDLFGTASLANGYRTRPRNKYGEDRELLANTGKRGFSICFPQAAIGPTYYLPFTANLILEVPDWSGKTERFGSVPNLAKELAEVLAIIEGADPEAAEAGQKDMHHDDRLASAYNAARIKVA